MRGDILILDVGDITVTAKRLRHLPDSELDDITHDELRRAAQLLRAGAYSATTVALRLEAKARAMRGEQ